MQSIHYNYNITKKKIENIIQKNNLLTKNVEIIAVSKNQHVNIVENAILSGIKNFGENYLQDSIYKIEQLKKYQNINWHFIGKIQSNKTKKIAQYFSWCQTIEQEKTAILLNQFRPTHLFPINVLIQIRNFEKINIEYYRKLIQVISSLPKLKLRGIMAMPQIKDNEVQNTVEYHKIQIIFQQFKKMFSAMDTLSLGTSFDIEESLLAGSNMVRIGRDIFKK